MVVVVYSIANSSACVGQELDQEQAGNNRPSRIQWGRCFSVHLQRRDIWEHLSCLSHNQVPPFTCSHQRPFQVFPSSTVPEQEARSRGPGEETLGCFPLLFVLLPPVPGLWLLSQNPDFPGVENAVECQVFF